MITNVTIPKQDKRVSRESWRVFMRYITISFEKKRYVAEFRGSERARPSARISVDKTLFEEFIKNLKIDKIEIEFKEDNIKIMGGAEIDEIRIRNLLNTISLEGKNIKVMEIYTTKNDIAFELSMIYTYLLRVLRKEERRRLNGRIIESLLRLNIHELNFWNHHFTRSKNRYKQDRVARAFLTLYNLR
jgi:hypothetical protein